MSDRAALEESLGDLKSFICSLDFGNYPEGYCEFIEAMWLGYRDWCRELGIDGEEGVV